MAVVELQKGPLPKKPTEYDSWNIILPKYSDAYDLAFEADVDATKEANDHPASHAAKENMVLARVVGYLLIELFDRKGVLDPTPCESVRDSILSKSQQAFPTTHGVVFEMGRKYRDHLIRAFRQSSVGYPEPSQHPSCPVFDNIEAMVNDVIQADGKDYRTVRKKVLARDGFRCMVTGAYDSVSMNKSAELSHRCKESGKPTVKVYSCHIISDSTMRDIDKHGPGGRAMENKRSFAITVVDILRDFGLGPLADGIAEENGIHDPGNMLSLQVDCHGYVNELNMWFESTDTLNKYRVCVADDGCAILLKMFGHLTPDHLGHPCVTFSTSLEGLQLPYPKLLALHAAFARVAHMSGAAEAFNEIECDIEETRVLAFDGSSARILDHLLTPLRTIHGVA